MTGLGGMTIFPMLKGTPKIWNRRCKIELIEQSNPLWMDLYDEMV